MILVMDIQGFNIESSKFIIKELACYDGSRISHYIFKPPFPLEMLTSNSQRKVDYMFRNKHGLRWESGFTPLHLFRKIIEDLTSSAKVIYIEGRENMNYLKQFTSKPIIELEGDASRILSTPKCFYHFNNIYNCALSNVYHLYEKFVMI